jgi:hypothetical protein
MSFSSKALLALSLCPPPAVHLPCSLVPSSMSSLDVLKDTSTITFNTSNLTINEVTLYSDRTEQIHADHFLDEKAERAAVQFSSPLKKGTKAQLRVRYEAKLTGDMMGDTPRAMPFARF